ncbi:transcription termination factor Rho, partial [bacterium]|nr:transcription termination factor Rho [bacterium]
ARNIEHGGSVTVVASALVETGSRMDDLIFEEFKGTGNSEIVLDRSLAENRVFPAIDLRASGTRRDELLYSVEDMARLNTLRRRMVQADPKTAMLGLLKLVEQTADNEALLRSVSAL